MNNGLETEGTGTTTHELTQHGSEGGKIWADGSACCGVVMVW